jgi:ketopantoate hydroxymethyltransferase
MILVQYCGRDARARDDAAMASAIARNMYGSGAEIIYHDAGASSGGLFAAAASQGKLAIGADLDQGRAESRRDALALQEAGATMIVLEAIPAVLAAEVTAMLHIITIGIGAGKDCSGQVLVVHDAFDIPPGKKAKFVRNFMDGASSVHDAACRAVAAVKDGSYPGPEHTYAP